MGILKTISSQARKGRFNDYRESEYAQVSGSAVPHIVGEDIVSSVQKCAAVRKDGIGLTNRFEDLEFANAQYVDIRPYAGNTASWQDKPMAYRWRNTLIVEHPNLAGKGTSSEQSYMYHQSAIGHAIDTGGMQSVVGYEEEQDYSYARCSAFMGATLLQNAGVVVITADGSAYA